MQVDKPPIVLTIDEYRILKQLAGRDNLPIGDFLRSLIAQEANRRGLLNIPPATAPGQTQTANGGLENGKPQLQNV